MSGRVRVNRDKNETASRAIKAGDTLTIGLDSGVRVLKVLACGERRGPPAEARLLYEDLSPPLPPALPVAVRDRGAGRPTKRNRRAIDGLRALGNDDFPRRDD